MGGEQMKVRDLIEALKKFPEDMTVLTDGYEGGFEEIRRPKIIKVKHESENPYYDGEYESVEENDGNSIKAVVISRNRRPD